MDAEPRVGAGSRVRAVLDGYEAAARPELIARFDALRPGEIYAPVIDLFPAAAARVADIGAGTGRDAAWFAARGHQVLAVEPVRALREAAMRLHDAPQIEWLDDRLPELEAAQARGPFELVTVSAVWQHLDDDARPLAMASLAAMAPPGGLVVLSLRHGPGAAGRQVFPASPDDAIGTARGCGLELVRRSQAASVQASNRASGVHWTWLALQRVR